MFAIGEEPADDLKKATMEAAIATGATQTSIGIALNFIPIVGTALAAIYSLVNTFTGRVVKKRIKLEMEGIKQRLMSHGGQRQQEVQAAVAKVEQEEREKLRQEGLGIDWGGAMKRLASVPDRIASVTEDPSKFKEEGTKVGGTITGRETLSVVRDKLNAVEADAKKKIDAQAADVVAQAQSPEGRAQIREQLLQDAGDSGTVGSALPWALGSLAVVGVAGILLLGYLRHRRK